MAEATSPLGGDDLAKALRDAYGRGAYHACGVRDWQFINEQFREKRDAWIAQYIARLPAAEPKGASFGPGCSASQSPSVSALSGEHPSRERQRRDEDGFACEYDPGCRPETDTYTITWDDGARWLIVDRYGLITAGQSPASDRAVQQTTWEALMLPAVTEASATEAGTAETGTGSVHEGAASVGETPSGGFAHEGWPNALTPKSSPSQTPVDPQMTVEEAREVLDRMPNGIAVTRIIKNLREQADQVELALRTLQAGGEVRDA